MDTFLFKPLVFNQKYLIPIHYDIVFYFSGNKREKRLKTGGAILSQTKDLSTILSHLLFWATNLPLRNIQ
jgi:hypothetical protein